MTRVPVGLALRDRLGENGVRDLQDHLEQHEAAWRVDVVNVVSEKLDYRFNQLDHRFNECAKREDMISSFARVAQQMADMKVDILRWSFLFWISQVATIAALLGYMLK